jgi:hypothetical protein
MHPDFLMLSLLTSDLLVSKHRYRMLPVLLPSLNLFSLEAFSLCLIMILIRFEVVCAKTIVLYAIHPTRFLIFYILPSNYVDVLIAYLDPDPNPLWKSTFCNPNPLLKMTSDQCMLRQEFIFYIYFIFCQSYIKSFLFG